MNKIRLGFVAFFLWTSISFAQTTDFSCIGFYNLENLFDTIDDPNTRDTEFTPNGKNEWTAGRYQEKLHNMAATISRIGVEHCTNGLSIIGLAEVENRSVLEDLVQTKELAERDYQIVHYDSPDARGIDVALIYQADAFTPTSSYNFPLIMPGIFDFETRDQLLVSGLLNGETVHILVNHWPSRYGGEEETKPMRRAAAELSKKISDSLLSINPKANIIIMGDLNDDPGDPSVLEVLNAGNLDEGASLYNPMLEKHQSGDGTLTYRGKWNLFDQIIMTPALVNGQNGLKYEGAFIHRDKQIIVQEGKYKDQPLRTFGGGRYLGGFSDHLPVYILLNKE